jgi:hypothetical protein
MKHFQRVEVLLSVSNCPAFLENRQPVSISKIPVSYPETR